MMEGDYEDLKLLFTDEVVGWRLEVGQGCLVKNQLSKEDPSLLSTVKLICFSSNIGVNVLTQLISTTQPHHQHTSEHGDTLSIQVVSSSTPDKLLALELEGYSNCFIDLIGAQPCLL
jgi:hypothetical protein